MAAARTAWRSLPDFLQTAAARVMPVLRSLAHAAIDTVFPPASLNCRQSTGAAHSLCASCWAQVRFIERPFCERLGTPFAMDLGNDGLLSPEAVANPPVYNRARAVAHFEDGPVRQLVHRLKYNDRMELAKPLGNSIRRTPRANYLRPMWRPGGSFRPRAGQADSIPGWSFAFAAGSQFTGRVSRDGRDGPKSRSPRRGAYR